MHADELGYNGLGYNGLDCGGLDYGGVDYGGLGIIPGGANVLAPLQARRAPCGIWGAGCGAEPPASGDGRLRYKDWGADPDRFRDNLAGSCEKPGEFRRDAPCRREDRLLGDDPGTASRKTRKLRLELF